VKVRKITVDVYAPFADEAERLRASSVAHGGIETVGAVQAKAQPRRISVAEAAEKAVIFDNGLKVPESQPLSRLSFYQTTQMIFQNPYSSLNPRKTVRQIVSVPLRNRGMRDFRAIEKEVASLLRTEADVAAARGPFYEQEMISLEDKIHEELEEVAAELRQQRFDVKTMACLGDPATEIVTYAKQERARTGIGQLLHGRVARGVMGSLDMPILLLRVPEETRPSEEPRLPGVELRL